MDMTLSINELSCIKCGKCVRVCPAVIFFRNSPGEKVELQNITTCISCGHCVAVCPTDSVVHSDFPPEKVHPVDREKLPTPEQVMLLCESRRSNRAFSSKPIPENILEQILKAAHLAPTASNKQQIEFTVITDPVKLQQISAYTIDIFSSITKRLENPALKFILKPLLPELYGYVPAFNRLVNEFKAGHDLILRKATAVIFIHTPKKNRFGCQDANLAYQNGSLMAESLGVSQFYTGFVCSAIQQDKNRSLAKLLNIEGTIHAGMALGLPDFKYPKYIDRKEIKVNYL